MKRHAIVMALAMATAPAVSFADLVAYQGFDGTTYTGTASLVGSPSGGNYNSATPLAGNTTGTGGNSFGWSGTWVRKFADNYTTIAPISTPGLSAPAGAADLITNGNAAQIKIRAGGGSATAVDLGLASTMGQTQPVYFSFLMSRPATDPATNLFLALVSAAGGSELVHVGYFGGTNFGLKIATGGGNFGQALTTTAVPDSTTTLLVAKLDYGAATGGLYTKPTLTLWINPTSGNEAAQGAGTSLTVTNSNGLGTVGGIRLSANAATSQNSGIFDEVRLGTSFADVVPTANPAPEPASLGVVALGIGALLMRGRKQ